MHSIATFSIVAYDSDRREWGVAVQSKFLAAAAVVSWAQAGAGAVATQAHANLTYGPQGLEMMEKGRQDGVDVAGDQYPYMASNTPLGSALLPRWAQVGGRQATIQRLEDPISWQQIRRYAKLNLARRGGPDVLTIVSFPPDKSKEGMSLSQVALEENVEPVEAFCGLYKQHEVSAIVHNVKEEDVETIARHPYIAVGSDGSSLSTEGPLAEGRPHPRNFGCFPRFLSRYQREKGLVSLEEAIRKMTSLPASRLGLSRRGRLAPGYAADIAVFDAMKVKDTATFEQPFSYPEGVLHVLVNGVPVVKDGTFTGQSPGRVLRDADS